MAVQLHEGGQAADAHSLLQGPSAVSAGPVRSGSAEVAPDAECGELTS